MKIQGQNIILIGFMGCGKSTLGKKIAKKLSYEFVDMDELIEKAEKKTVSQIFEENGEEYFRLKEKELLQTFIGSNQKIISTGGGAPCFINNMELINNLGVSIYIKLSPKALVSRLLNEKGKRPLISQLSNEELLQFITDSLSKRELFYNQAMVIYNSFNESEQDLLKRI